MSDLDSASIAEHTFSFGDSSADFSIAVAAVALANDPKQLGPYKILREIGRGAMGTVYEANHAQLERRVALKVLPPELATSPKRLQRFRREMAAVGRLDHPNIVLATDAGEIDGLCYIAMQFVDGPDLEQVLEEIGRFEPADACEIVRQTALGLEHIGQQELVHRDIKPSNILLTRTGQAKILDLGIAMLRNAEQLDTSMTVVGSMMGTPDYIAPEQITQCADVDIRADIYSLGCTLYCLLSGKSPFNGPGYTTLTAKLLAHASKTPPSLAEAHAEIPEGIVALVEQMMSKHADDRPATPGEIAKLLAPFCKGADLVPIATGQRKGAPLKPLDLPTAVETEKALEAKAKADSQEEKSLVQKFDRQKFIWGGAVAAALAGVLWLGTAQPIASSDQPLVVANTTLQAKVDRTQAMIANINYSISESEEINARRTGKLATTLSDMQKQFARREMESGVQSVAIRNPRSPVDHYYNARLFSQMGDHQSAKDAYLAYFAKELPVVDPHLNFVEQLKIREGTEGARAVYNAMPGDRASVGRKLALAMLESDDRISDALEQVVAEHPDSAPAIYLLSQQFSPETNERKTLSDSRRQRELLHQFVSLHEQGQLSQHFLDQRIPAGQLEKATRRLKEISVSAAAANHVPVRLNSANNIRGYWRIGVLVDEFAEEIFWAIGDTGEFESTGPASGVISAARGNGKLRPSPFFAVSNRQLTESADDLKIYVKYTDSKGEMQGPFALDFDPVAAAIEDKKRIVKDKPLSWASFKQNKLLFGVFKMHANSIIEAVHYGLNDKEPTLSMPVPEEEFGLSNLSDFELPVESDVDFVTLQVTFKDGTLSKVVRIDRE